MDFENPPKNSYSCLCIDVSVQLYVCLKRFEKLLGTTATLHGCSGEAWDINTAALST